VSASSRLAAQAAALKPPLQCSSHLKPTEVRRGLISVWSVESLRFGPFSCSLIEVVGMLDGVRILAPRTVRLMTTNQVGTLHSANGLGYGLGFETTDRYGANGMDSEGSFGWGGAYGSMYRVDPTAHLTMVLMINQIPNATDILQRFPRSSIRLYWTQENELAGLPISMLLTKSTRSHLTNTAAG
jgi:Beta-lactamase